MNTKEFFKLISILMASFLVAFFLGILFESRLFVIFGDIVFAITAIVTFYAAASWVFLNYLDNILKDISPPKEISSKESYLEAIYKFGNLKAEIVNNVLLILILFIFDRLANGIFLMVYDPTMSVYQAIPNIVFSLRLAFFSVVIIAVFSHLRGFIVALEYRNIIARCTRK